MENRATSSESFLEKLGTTLDKTRHFVRTSWQITLLMGKGAYLVTERNRLFTKIGREIYEKSQPSLGAETPCLPPEVLANVADLIFQVGKLTKKIELEEMLIRKLRFGSARRRSSVERKVVDNST